MCVSDLCVSAPAIVDVNTPPFLLPEFVFLSQQNNVQLVSSMVAFRTSECSHALVITRMQQFVMSLSDEIQRFSSSILFTMDLAFERNMLGSGGLCGQLFSLRQPRFCSGISSA